jgi:hypothetical protein
MEVLTLIGLDIYHVKKPSIVLLIKHIALPISSQFCSTLFLSVVEISGNILNIPFLLHLSM